MNEQQQTDKAADAFDRPALARTPTRDIFGKLDDKLPEVRVPGEVKLDAERAAAAEGLDVTGWMRELVYDALYGSEHVASLYRARMERVRGNARRREPIGLRVAGEVRAE